MKREGVVNVKVRVFFRARQDKTRQTKQDKTRQGEIRQDQTRQGK